MRIDKAIDKMKSLKYKALQGAIIVHDTYSDDYELLNESALTALGMAIASLEAWQKVQQDIKELADYDTVDVLVDVNRIINKHLQQIGDDPKMLMLIQNEDGVFEEYDDIYDITIHCHNKYEHDVILAWMNKLNKPDHESDDGK